MFRQSFVSSRRLFSITPRRSNLVSDLYIQNIKQFKPTPLSEKEVESAVKKFQLPAKPTVPAEEISADALSQYESSDVETVQVSSSGEGEPVEENWFVFEEEKEHH